MAEGRSFAHDEKAQELAEQIERAQVRAIKEFSILELSRAPSLKVGAAMAHAKAQKEADELRVVLMAYVESGGGA